MQKFKYLFKEKETLSNLNELNNLGEEGWELVGVSDEQTNKAIFKKTIYCYNDKYETVGIEDRCELKIYENNDIAVIFQGIELREFLISGLGFAARLLIENKTGHTIDVNALKVKLNGFFVAKELPISRDLPAKKRRLDLFRLDIPTLKNYEVYSISDMRVLEFQISYITVDGRIKNTSEIIKIEPFEF
ncbi:MAG: hypothetical protein IKJ19_05060 [Clostridia bacterium]|nr:hypothetical protein [Clostridia bacterium]